ncbi:MAG TPA: DUF2784 domain-containing protein [Micromonosporaceae bacterium]|nr:DUF2784 domain-containing protein [Micromonosporaceae bacterium]
MGYRALTTLVLVTHFAYLAYVVLGGFLAWRWPRAIWPHLAAAAWGLVAISVPTICPLTWAEDWSRQRAGESGLTQGFVDRYIEGVLYPAQYTAVLQALAAAAVVVSWTGFVLRWRARRRAGTPERKSAGSSEGAATV